MLVGAVSCSDDDKAGGQAGDATLIGLWEVTGEYDDEEGVWDYEFGAQYGYEFVTEFRADGSGCAELTDGSEVQRVDFTYTVEGSTLTVHGDGDPIVQRIDKLTFTELVLSETYQWEGKTYTDLLVCRRVR
jgi:hypothetical protein